jgi:hypothetical protein
MAKRMVATLVIQVVFKENGPTQQWRLRDNLEAIAERAFDEGLYTAGTDAEVEDARHYLFLLVTGLDDEERRKDIPNDAEEWKSELEAKAEESRQLAVRILNRVPALVHRIGMRKQHPEIVERVVRTLAAVKSRSKGTQQLRPVTITLVREAARTFGYFLEEEATTIAEAIVAELGEDENL